MAAPKGNQFWKLRSKHGRNKLFETPELLWEAACEYFSWVDNNPLTYEKVVGTKNLDKIDISAGRPYTMHGLCLYLDCNTQYFLNFKKQNKDKDFNWVITRIEETIYNQKFEGAAVGIFQHNIIARDLGLADKQEHSGTQTVIWHEEKTYEADNKADKGA